MVVVELACVWGGGGGAVGQRAAWSGRVARTGWWECCSCSRTRTGTSTAAPRPTWRERTPSSLTTCATAWLNTEKKVSSSSSLRRKEGCGAGERDGLSDRYARPGPSTCCLCSRQAALPAPSSSCRHRDVSLPAMLVDCATGAVPEHVTGEEQEEDGRAPSLVGPGAVGGGGHVHVHQVLGAARLRVAGLVWEGLSLLRGPGGGHSLSCALCIPGRHPLQFLWWRRAGPPCSRGPPHKGGHSGHGGWSSSATSPPSVKKGRYMGAHSSMGRVVCRTKVSTTCAGRGGECLQDHCEGECAQDQRSAGKLGAVGWGRRGMPGLGVSPRAPPLHSPCPGRHTSAGCPAPGGARCTPGPRA